MLAELPGEEVNGVFGFVAPVHTAASMYAPAAVTLIGVMTALVSGPIVTPSGRT